ncbi:cold-shock protein [Kineothrix sedimenti]|uniref:Uncharacterized protein n=1 Tax=Kineothrix sedimenti TaxID=3123317 RepID=A0ABZ3EZP0_9FIRM
MNNSTAKWLDSQKGAGFISDVQDDNDFVQYKTIDEGQSVIFDLMLQKVLMDYKQSMLALHK